MRAKRKCELCSNQATIFCGSDQASLCCECDSKVHGANFLVAKHSRTLLCHVCQSLTPWTGSGPKLGPTVSVCQTCLNANKDANHGGINDEDLLHVDDEDHQNNDEDDDDGSGDEDDDGSGDEDDDELDENDNHHGGDEDEDEDDEDNQVVPWSYSVSHPR